MDTRTLSTFVHKNPSVLTNESENSSCL